MKRITLLFSIVLLLTSCAKIPVQSVALADALKEEGKRMHGINLALLNSIFNNKKKELNDFIENTYTPAYLEHFKTIIPPGTDFKAKFNEIFQAALPEINLTKDSLLNALDLQKAKLTEKLNKDYEVFENAADEMKRLLVSAVKLNEAKMSVYNQAKTLSKGQLDISRVEAALENFLLKGGNVAGKITALNDNINSIINK